MQELRPGLWRWTGLHLAWQEGAAWAREVGCVYYEAPEHVVLIDPLVPPEDEQRFLAALDRDVERLGRPVAIVLTCARHRRSTELLVERYGAEVGPVRGVEELPVEPYGEFAVWIPEHRALVLGNVLAGSPVRPPPPDRVPEEWRGRYAEPLRFLLDLPVELLLPSHGHPVTRDAREALAGALSEPDTAVPPRSGV